MSARKRPASPNSSLQPPPLKVRSTATKPRLEHNGRLALICFLAHRSHRPTTPDLEDIEMSVNSTSSPSSSTNSVPEDGDQQIEPEAVGPDDENGVEMEDQLSDEDSENESTTSASTSGSFTEHERNLQFLVESDAEDEDEEYAPEMAANNEDETTSSDSSEASTSGESLNSLEDEGSTTESEESSAEEHVFLNLLQVLEAAAANDSETSSSYIEADRATRRVLMISTHFLRSFFAGHDTILKVDYDYLNFDLILEWQSVGASMFQLNAKTLSTLIGLSDLRKIHITAYAIFDDRPMNIPKGMQSWLQVCRALRESKTLESISLEVGQTRPSLYRMFFDMLPDKLKEVKAKTSVVHGLRERRCVLDGVYLFDCTKKHPDYGQIFRTKTKLLDLSRCSSVMLNDFANIGILSSNPYLEQLKIGVLLKDSSDQNCLLKGFEKKNWAKLKKSLECLKLVNQKMRLKLITGVFYGDRVKNLRFGVDALKQALDNSKQLIDLAKEVGFQMGKVKICDLVLCSRRCPRNVLQRMAQAINLKPTINDDAIVDSVIHEGVEISVKLCYGISQYFSDC